MQNILGRTMLTTNAVGTNTSNGIGPASTFQYDPFGNMVAASNHPNNTTNGSYGFGGSRQKLTETTFALAPVQMGARVYLASIARFTSLDPVAGGTANNYVYALDPINFSDYSGNCILQCAGGSSLQGSTRIVQGSSPAIQGSKVAVQTTISSQRLQGTRATTIYIRAIPKSTAKPAPTYDNSTRMGVAKTKTLAVHVLDAIAFVDYGGYYVAYRFAKSTPGVSPMLMAAQVGGLGGDISINYIKTRMGYPQQLNDYGYYGDVLPDFAQKLLGVEGPKTYIPGWHYDDASKIDFAW